MRIALSLLNELAQKCLIGPLRFEFESEGADHQKTFRCTLSIPEYPTTTATAYSKAQAKHEAAERMLVQVEATIDVNAKPKIRGMNQQAAMAAAASSPRPQEANNPVSQLLEWGQAELIPFAEYRFDEHPTKPVKNYTCFCKLESHETQVTATSKKKAKMAASQQMVDWLLAEGRIPEQREPVLSTGVRNQAHTPAVPPQNALGRLNELLVQQKIPNLSFDFKDIGTEHAHHFQCVCQVGDQQVVTEASNKKLAKHQAGEAMLAQLDGQQTLSTQPAQPKESDRHLVEPNACAQWIHSICPDQVDLRSLAWYLTNDTVLLKLGLKKPNPKAQVQALKQQIVDETGLLVLISYRQNLTATLNQLTQLADETGCLTQGDCLEPLCLGHAHYGQPHFDEPTFTRSGRTDHTADHCFTVDSKSARDLDDAFSVLRADDTGVELAVHIADVAHWVPADSREDQQARQQGFTYYGASRQLFMLPPKLTYQASLLPEKERLAWTIRMALDAQARLLHYDIYPSVVRSQFRLDQPTVNRIIQDTSHPERARFKQLAQLSEQLKEQRLNRGGLNEMLGEHIGYQLVQEFMLLTNRCIAQFCAEKKISIPFRTHRFPDQSTDLRALYNATADHRSLLPFLGRASYQVLPCPHEALTFDHYCHFTSPIRRYADLVVQRQLTQYHHHRPLLNEADLSPVVQHLNQAETQLNSTQVGMRYLERLQVQFRRVNQSVKVIIEQEQPDYYLAKALSMKHNFRLRLPKATTQRALRVGDECQVIQLPRYHVLDEVFDCVPN